MWFDSMKKEQAKEELEEEEREREARAAQERHDVENQILTGNEAPGVRGAVHGSRTGDFMKEARDAEKKEWRKVMETTSVTSTSTANEFT
ncbi:unnamed protein product [Linum trigynum]|uniref:Uncharacterized protein n=1 Tax=Linum trigynum TaxID=586398 RepID=A0AAV2D6W4_9ROSI